MLGVLARHVNVGRLLHCGKHCVTVNLANLRNVPEQHVYPAVIKPYNFGRPFAQRGDIFGYVAGGCHTSELNGRTEIPLGLPNHPADNLAADNYYAHIAPRAFLNKPLKHVRLALDTLDRLGKLVHIADEIHLFAEAAVALLDN